MCHLKYYYSSSKYFVPIHIIIDGLAKGLRLLYCRGVRGFPPGKTAECFISRIWGRLEGSARGRMAGQAGIFDFCYINVLIVLYFYRGTALSGHERTVLGINIYEGIPER